MKFEDLKGLRLNDFVFSTQRGQWGRVVRPFVSHYVAIEFDETRTDVTILYVGKDTCDLYRRPGDPYP